MKELKIALGVIALAASAHANATCMDNLVRLLHPAAAPATAVEAAARLPAVPAAHLISVADWDGDDGPAGIVGLWQFQLSGIDTDWGSQAWHADGTEIMFSAGQNPATGDVCQGVWQQTGPRTYTLNHIAMGWSGVGVDPNMPGVQFERAHFHMMVKLDPSGQTFSGSYSIALYMESKDDPFNEDPQSNPPFASGTGAIKATRVNPDR